jgi:hypothetical protein
VELLRDQLPIDAFSIVIDDGKVICIEDSMNPDSGYIPTSNYPQERITDFPIYQREFLLWGQSHARREKLKRLFS